MLTANEDVIFAMAACAHGRSPSMVIAERFAIESVCPDSSLIKTRDTTTNTGGAASRTAHVTSPVVGGPPFGMHKPWRYLTTRLFESWNAGLLAQLGGSKKYAV